ncbi:Uncharacterised protein [Mycobacterium tuberculosis]|uniref:Uncharacterized protein n=1 Tax=Mycobacterium tuberculosis TaxID=1773 RepID=A0A655AEA5_MYCTX|nr:Uncharacterised protein [Mycobacterium tuberculosis]
MRKRVRRSWSTSAVRSLNPSPSTCCHSAVCCTACWASRLRRSKSEASRSRRFGSLTTDSSEPRDTANCSVAERISPSTPARTRSVARESTCSLRNLTIAGKLDSSLSSLSLSVTAWLRNSDETAMIGIGTRARCRCAALALTISRQRGYRSVLVATTAPTGQIWWACRTNHISGSVNSWLVSLTTKTASASGSSPSVADRWGCPRPPTPGVSINASPPRSSGLGAPTSTRNTSRPPACGARRTSVLMSSTGMSTAAVVPSGPAASTSRADGWAL